MTTSPTLDVSISNKNYCQIAINTFQRYVNNNFEGKLFWKSIKIVFENWIKKH